MNDTIYEEMRKLSEEILHLNDRFHNHDEEPILNSEFDKKQERFDELCELYPDIGKLFTHHQKAVPLVEVTNEGLAVVEFDEPMLSLKKKLTQDQLEQWLTAFPLTTGWVREFKMDGLALEILYIDWELKRIATRGDGNVGEDVTHSLPLFRNIPNRVPKNFPQVFSVRGEGVMSFDTFNAYNEAVEKQIVTPRNGVSGWVRRLAKNQDPTTFGLLDFFVYGASDRLGADKYSGLMFTLGVAGFTTGSNVSLDEVKADVRSLTHPVDGVVFKIDDFKEQDKLGVTNKYPNWAVAYKFPDIEVEVAYSHTVWATGKTGRVNPTLYFHPAIVGGVTCKRASVDNYHQFMALELRADTLLAVTRNGDVIPRVRRVIDRGVGERERAPEFCPSCGSTLRMKVSNASAFLYCDNVAGCSSQLLNRCLAFVGRQCLDIDGLGPVTLGQLIDNETIEYPADILFLNPAEIPAHVWTNIINVHFVPMHRAILALGLPGIDVIRAKKLARAINKVGTDQGFQNPVSWINSEVVTKWLSDTDNIKKIHGFGIKLAAPIVAAVKTDAFLNNCRRLFKKIEVTYKEDITEKKICITGDVGLARESLKDLLELVGIELVDNLTKDCQMLLVGEKPGEGKLSKATALDIPMVTIARVSSIEDLISQINSHN